MPTSGINHIRRDGGVGAFLHRDIVDPVVCQQISSYSLVTERVASLSTLGVSYHFMPAASWSSSLVIREFGQFFRSCLENKPGQQNFDDDGC